MIRSSSRCYTSLSILILLFLFGCESRQKNESPLDEQEKTTVKTTAQSDDSAESSLVFNAEQPLKTEQPSKAEQPSSTEHPLQVFIMMGQSNMVGFGKINGRSERLGNAHVSKAVASVYEGKYDPKKDYDKAKAMTKKDIPEFGGTKPTPFPEGGTVVTRGKISMQPNTYLFRMGWGDSTHSLFEINGVEVYRKEVDQKKPTRQPFKFEEGKIYDFKLTSLNKSGRALGWFEPTYVPGSLTSMVKVGKEHTYLLDEKGDWAEREDVFFYDARTKRKCSPLNPLSNGGKFGPELGFGNVVGDHLDAPVLLIKSCIGNRSLGWDLLPPESSQYEHEGKVYAGYKESPLSWEKGSKPKPINWYAGKQWDIDIGNAKKALQVVDHLVPESKGYEIAGFVYWQGDKDRYNEGHAIRYEKNLAHLIKTLRKEFNAPKAKFVLATLGQTPRDGGENPNEKLIIDAMFAVDGKEGKFPEFKGNVSTVYSHPISKGGASNGHYNGHAETYLNVGLALGEAMKNLLKK